MHELIGEGGMARVHLGVCRGPDGSSQPVVVKRLHDALSLDPAAVRRFRHEARLHAFVRHPNVVAIRDVGRDAEGHFIVLEWIDGLTLHALVGGARRRGVRVDIGVTTKILIDALHGLHAAHSARDFHGAPLGIVHRDASPDNILVGRDGRARITDFGVAKCPGGPSITTEGGFVGKVLYMAPEYLERRTVDGRADVYAIGVVAWVALSGRKPFGDERGVPDDAATRRIPELDPCLRVPPGIARVVHRACRADPDERYASAAAMARELFVAASEADCLGSRDEVGAAVARAMDAARGSLPTLPAPPDALPSPWMDPGIEGSSWLEEDAPTRQVGVRSSEPSRASPTPHTPAPPPRGVPGPT